MLSGLKHEVLCGNNVVVQPSDNIVVYERVFVVGCNCKRQVAAEKLTLKIVVSDSTIL